MASTNHLQDFFNNYPEFNYVPANGASGELYRMYDFFGWDRDEKEEAKELFKDALVQEFNKIYGTDENDIESWHTLCRVLTIDPIPDGLKACREVFSCSVPLGILC